MKKPVWISFTMLLVLVSLSFLGHKKLVQYENERLESIIDTEKQRLSVLFEDRIDDLFLAFSRMSKRFDIEADKTRWVKDVSMYITEFNEIKLIEWVDKETDDHWSFPELTEVEKEGHDHIDDILSREGSIFINDAKKDYLVTIHGTKNETGDANGYLVGHIKISSMIKSFLQTNYSVKIFEDNQLIFRNKYSFNVLDKFNKSFEHNARGLKWTVVIAPTASVLANNELFIVKFFLPVTFILSTLITFLLYFLIHQSSLKKDLLSRKEQTENIIKSFPDLTFIVNQQGKVIESNNGTGNESFTVLQEFLGDNIFSLLPDGYAESFYNAIYAVVNGKDMEKVQFSLAFGSEDSHYEATLTRFDYQYAFMTIRDKTADFQQKRNLEDQLSEEEVIKNLLEIASQNLTFEDKLQEALEVILSIPWLKDDGRGGVYRIDEKGDLELCVESKLDNEVLIGQRKVPVGKFPIGQAAETMEVQHFHKVDWDKDFTYDGMKDHGKYCVPVISNNETVGVIMLYLFADHKKNISEIRFLKNIANALAPIFRNENLERELDKERLVALEKSRLAALGEMGGGIAHEINNPLFIVIGNISRLETQLKKPQLDMEKINKIVKTMDETAWRMSKIIKGLRDFSRDGSDEEYELISFKAIVDETLALCSEKLSMKSIDVDIIGSDVEFAARRIQFSQVLLNLFQNSYDAICEQVGDKWIKLYVGVKEDILNIHYVDSGNGIPQQIREKIFQPFYTTKETGKGTGLGLSISLGLIESHEGTFEYLEHNGNTGFRISIPLHLEAVQRKGDPKIA